MQLELQPLPKCTWEKLGERKKKQTTPQKNQAGWLACFPGCLMVTDAHFLPCSEEPPGERITGRTKRAFDEKSLKSSSSVRQCEKTFERHQRSHQYRLKNYMRAYGSLASSGTVFIHACGLGITGGIPLQRLYVPTQKSTTDAIKRDKEVKCGIQTFHDGAVGALLSLIHEELSVEGNIKAAAAAVR